MKHFVDDATGLVHAVFVHNQNIDMHALCGRSSHPWHFIGVADPPCRWTSRPLSCMLCIAKEPSR